VCPISSKQPKTIMTTILPQSTNSNRNQIHTQEMKLLKLGFQYSIKNPITTYLTDLITETKNAIQLLDAKLLNAYHILATKHLKQILNSSNSYILHKRKIYAIK
jgi:hypothetical protein